VNDYGVTKQDWSSLPYGPYKQKSFAWDDKILGGKDASEFQKPTYGDSAGIWSGTLAQMHLREDPNP
jgi:hypothetical protein